MATLAEGKKSAKHRPRLFLIDSYGLFFAPITRAPGAARRRCAFLVVDHAEKTPAEN
jgi:hypothetical protein